MFVPKSVRDQIRKLEVKPGERFQICKREVDDEGELSTFASMNMDKKISRDELALKFGVLDLETGFEGCRFSIGIRNSHDKSFRLAVTAGLRVTVCENMMFNGDFTPVLAKHSKNFSLQDCLCIGVDRMQRNFEPEMAGGAVAGSSDP
jgi:hypothetical protein